MHEPSSNTAGPLFDATLTSETFPPTTPLRGAVTSSSVVTPVRRTVAPGLPEERERRRSVLNSSALLTSFARGLFSEKTRPGPGMMLLGLGGDFGIDSKTLATWSCPSESAPVALALTTSGTGCSCSPSRPTPSASLFGCRDVERMLARRERLKQKHGNGNGFGLTLGQWCAVNETELTPEMVEEMLGFPRGWTDCECSAMLSMSGSDATSASS